MAANETGERALRGAARLIGNEIGIESLSGYLRAFPQPATVVFEPIEGDHMGLDHWWAFCAIRLGRRQGRAWVRYFAGPMRPEPASISDKLPKAQDHEPE